MGIVPNQCQISEVGIKQNMYVFEYILEEKGNNLFYNQLYITIYTCKFKQYLIEFVG